MGFILEGDFLITGAGTLGLIIEVPRGIEKGIINQALIRLRLNNSVINKDYFRYYFSSSIKNIACKLNGDSVIPNLPPIKILKEIDINIPSMDEQKNIGTFLNQIDLKIQNNKKQIETLESLAKTIYDYWFVQFDFPNEDGKPYKSSGGKMVWNEELKREIPDGWEKSCFNELILTQISGDWGKEFAQKNYKHKAYCIRGTDFSSINSTENSEIPIRYILEKNLDKRLSDGDIIIEISGGSPSQSTGRLSYITNKFLQRYDHPILVSNFCRTLRLKNIHDVFWIYLTWSRLYTNGVFFNYESKTTGIKNLMLDHILKSLSIVIPPLCYRENFYKVISPFYFSIQNIKKENQELLSLKDFLIPLLMNGQVSIR